MKEKKDEATYEICSVAKPDYNELCKQVEDLNYQLRELIDENNALRWSLTTAHKEMTDWINRSATWQENYYKEHERAEKLFDELEKLKKNIKE